jgi:hypothetical protein
VWDDESPKVCYSVSISAIVSHSIFIFNFFFRVEREMKDEERKDDENDNQNHKSPSSSLACDVNFLANRLRKCRISNMFMVYKFLFCLFALTSSAPHLQSLCLRNVSKRWWWGGEDECERLKRTTLEGNMFCACVTRILKKPAKGKCLAFRIFRNKKKASWTREGERKVDGKMLRRITLCMCTIFWFVCRFGSA